MGRIHTGRGRQGVTGRKAWRKKGADEGLLQAGAGGGEQTLLAGAKFSCRGDTVRIFSPMEQVHCLNNGQKKMLPFYCLLDPPHPGIPLLLGVGMNFIHLRTSR